MQECIICNHSNIKYCGFIECLNCSVINTGIFCFKSIMYNKQNTVIYFYFDNQKIWIKGGSIDCDITRSNLQIYKNIINGNENLDKILLLQ